MKPKRFYEIDLLRFLAALSVLFFHYTFRGYAADDMSPLAFPALGEVFKYGYLGVDLFFIISGFVILLSARNRSSVSFAISRIIRIYPAYWIGVSLSALVMFAYGGERYPVSAVQYLVNLTMVHEAFGIDHVDGVYWSLIVELKFYALILILIAIRQMDRMLYFFTAWLAAAYASYFLDVPGIVESMLILKWTPYFVAGAIFYLIKTQGISIARLSILALCYVLSLLNGLRALELVSIHYKSELSSAVVIALISVFYGFFLLLSLGKTEFFNVKHFTTVGALTYPLYLVHQNIGFIFFQRFHDEGSRYVLLFVMTVIALSLAYLINKYVEQRYALKLKEALTRSSEALKNIVMGRPSREEGGADPAVDELPELPAAPPPPE